jgi:hypothetical protein
MQEAVELELLLKAGLMMYLCGTFPLLMSLIETLISHRGTLWSFAVVAAAVLAICFFSPWSA